MPEQYFSPNTQENPLLHLWYMGVICQLYVLAPLLVIPWVRKWGKRVAGVVLGVAAALSLLMWIATTTDELLAPDARYGLLQSMYAWNSYYHLLPRLWVVIAGYSVVFLPGFRNARWQGVCATAALAGIILCFFLFPKGSSFSYPAVVLAVLLLKYGDAGACGRFLRWRPVQFLGGISFSLYLWHWPVLAVYKYFATGGVGLWDEAVMLAVSFLLAYLAWRYIEKNSGKRLLENGVVLSLLATLFFIAGATKRSIGGRDDRLLAQACAEAGLQASVNSAVPFKAEDLPAVRLVRDFPGEFTTPPIYLGEDADAEPVFFLMGDSHATNST